MWRNNSLHLMLEDDNVATNAAIALLLKMLDPQHFQTYSPTPQIRCAETTVIPQKTFYNIMGYKFHRSSRKIFDL